MTAKRLIDKVGITLLDAASLIEEHGWWNGKKNPHGRMCAYMAIDLVCEGDMNRMGEAFMRLERYLGNDSVIWWNDSCPDQATVTTAMRAAAQELEA